MCAEQQEGPCHDHKALFVYLILLLQTQKQRGGNSSRSCRETRLHSEEASRLPPSTRDQGPPAV